jgi:hypothetical protein
MTAWTPAVHYSIAMDGARIPSGKDESEMIFRKKKDCSDLLT